MQGSSYAATDRLESLCWLWRIRSISNHRERRIDSLSASDAILRFGTSCNLRDQLAKPLREGYFAAPILFRRVDKFELFDPLSTNDGKRQRISVPTGMFSAPLETSRTWNRWPTRFDREPTADVFTPP
jgi:hypothetical protein